VRPEDPTVIRETADAIRRLHREGIPYADIFSPLGDEQLAESLRRASVLCRLDAMGAREQELLTPPIFGRYVMTISNELTPQQRAFAIRHGFGHVTAGHVAEITLLSTSRDWFTHEERVADLFALADLIPFWLLEQLRRGQTGWRPMRKLIERVVGEHTVGWSDGRCDDRALLRIAMYRTEGI
jgi:hypothetical protein